MNTALTIQEFQEKIFSQEISLQEHTEKILEEAKKTNSYFHHFNCIAEKQAMQRAQELEKQLKKENKPRLGRLFGVPVSIKDCICVKEIESTAGSKILKGYKPLFNATVVQKALNEGAIIIGKTSQDEFGFGGFSKNTGIGFEIPKNPLDEQRSCGGSSGGSAGFTALTKLTHASIAESTGGSIACPASFCGVVGITPTYGRVSRFGLIDYANSLDKIGAIGKNVHDSALLLESIAGFDEKDSTSLTEKVEQYSKIESENEKKQKFKVGIIEELFREGINEEVKNAIENKISRLEANGFSFQKISMPLSSKHGIPAYYLIAMTEASTNLAKYCGMRYGMHEKLEGNFNEYFTKVRTSNFGEEAKRRIIIGTFARMSGFREAYYLKAMKARTLIIEEFQKVFKKFDFLLHPTMPVIAPKFSEIEKMTPLENYLMDVCTVPANLAGLPHASINAGFSKQMPVGLMLTANYLQEKKLMQALKKIEEI